MTDGTTISGVHQRDKRSVVTFLSEDVLRYGLPKSLSPTKVNARPKTAADRQARVAEILKRLDRMYPDVTCALTHGNPWQLLVATILSAQCTDKRVNEVTPGLFVKYPAPADFAA